MLFGICLFIFVVVCILLCLLILIQSDKGGGISGAIGGGLAGASSMFGTQDTANVLTKLTTGFAAAFGGLCIIMSLFLSHPSAQQQKSMLKERATQRQDFSPSSVLPGQQTLPIAPQGKGGQGLPLQNDAQKPGNQGLPLQKTGQNSGNVKIPSQQQQKNPSGNQPALPQAPAGKDK
jgi:preprotein translocase subunit SecG